MRSCSEWSLQMKPDQDEFPWVQICLGNERVPVLLHGKYICSKGRTAKYIAWLATWRRPWPRFKSNSENLSTLPSMEVSPSLVGPVRYGTRMGSFVPISVFRIKPINRNVPTERNSLCRRSPVFGSLFHHQALFLSFLLQFPNFWLESLDGPSAAFL
jgi:hypothetical protein